MARTTVDLTDTFQEVATDRCVITIIRSGRYHFNDESQDANASQSYFKAGEQIVQTEAKTTYARGAGGTVIVDQEG